MHPMLNIAIRAARKAGDIIAQSMDRIDRVDIQQKSDKSFVTSIDLAAEQVILDTINQAYPDHNTLSEEAGEIINDPQSEDLWIIDPLDGTTNFIRSLPYFCISIAMRGNNHTQHAVIYDPVNDDLFTASKGDGAMLNNRRIRISQQKELDDAVLAAALPSLEQFGEHYPQYFAQLHSRAAGIRRTGACALDLAHLAAGRIDAMWQPSLKPWDVAAGALLIREAGGVVCDLSGGSDFLKEQGIIAANNKLLPKIVKELHTHLPNKVAS